MYRCGQGVPKDEKKAVEWYRKSAMQDNAHAQNDLGIMYANGLGVAMDQVEAVNWYRRAAEKWHADAQNNLGWMYAKGLGVEKNEKEAVKLYKMAAYQGNINAMRNLALMYETGRGVPQDLEEAQRWRTKADAKENDLKNSSQKKVELPKKTVVPKPKQEQKYVPVLKLPDRKPIKVHERRRPINLNFCPHCGSSLKHLEKISQNCPDCKKDLSKK